MMKAELGAVAWGVRDVLHGDHESTAQLVRHLTREDCSPAAVRLVSEMVARQIAHRLGHTHDLDDVARFLRSCGVVGAGLPADRVGGLIDA